MNEKILRLYKKQITFNNSKFYDKPVVMRRCGKLRVKGDKILTKILNNEL